jgi:hypothetical protein
MLEVEGPGGVDRLVMSGLLEVLGKVAADGAAGDERTVAADGAQSPVLGEGLKIDFGEVAVDHEWQWVPFARSFVDPVVIAAGLSSNGPDPALVAVDGVDVDGFWIRVQEWVYLDIWHVVERAGFVVLERGSHRLSNGVRIEAGRVPVSGLAGFEWVGFGTAFSAPPVVLAARTEMPHVQALAIRLRAIDSGGFELRLDPEEALPRPQLTEQVSYIAWEPSSGCADGVCFDVGRTGDSVDSGGHWLPFGFLFKAWPAFLVGLQTTNGGEPAAVRWSDGMRQGVAVQVEEEQSQDAEMDHAREAVGYFALERDGS